MDSSHLGKKPIKHPAPAPDSESESTSPVGPGCPKKLKQFHAQNPYNNNNQIEFEGISSSSIVLEPKSMSKVPFTDNGPSPTMKVEVCTEAGADSTASSSPPVPVSPVVTNMEPEGINIPNANSEISESETRVIVPVPEMDQDQEDAVADAVNSTDVEFKDDDKAPEKLIKKITCMITSCTAEFDSKIEADNHFKIKHLFACSQCKRPMATPHLLELHVLEFHDSFFAVQAERKPMYSCFLQKCKEKLSDPDQRYVHCVSNHTWAEKFILRHEFKSFLCQLKKQPSLKQPKKNEISGEADGIKMETEASAGEIDLPQDPGAAPIDNPIKEDKGKGKQKSKRPHTQTKPAVHISFGRHVGKFIPNQVFAMHKPKKSSDKSEDNEMGDLNDLKVALDVD